MKSKPICLKNEHCKNCNLRDIRTISSEPYSTTAPPVTRVRYRSHSPLCLVSTLSYKGIKKAKNINNLKIKKRQSNWNRMHRIFVRIHFCFSIMDNMIFLKKIVEKVTVGLLAWNTPWEVALNAFSLTKTLQPSIQRFHLHNF